MQFGRCLVVALMGGSALWPVSMMAGEIKPVVQPKQKADPATTQTPQSVEQLLVLGRRLKASTDGTGTYTVPAISINKMLMKLQDVPQSVSVLTSQQMKDQNLFTVDAALKQVAGLNVNNYGDGTSGYTSRGFSLAPQYDGVPSANGLTFVQQFDLAIYDRLEVARGPESLFQGAASPGGSVNFVRKRPTEQFSGNASYSYGSWNNNHATFDIGGPLARSRYISGRLIVAGTDRGFFYDNGRDRRWTVYGVVDIRPTTHDTLTLSVASQSNETRRFMGVPRAADGSDLKYARNTWTGANFNSVHAPMTELSAQWEHVFGHGWRALVNGRHRSTDTAFQYAYLTTWNSTTQRGNVAIVNTKYAETNNDVDGYVTGPVHLFGQTHSLVFGGNYSRYIYNGAGASVTSSTNKMLQNMSLADMNGLSSALLPTITSQTYQPMTQWGVYGQARIKPVHNVAIMLGGRVSGYLSQTQTRRPTTLAMTTRIDQSGILLPYMGATWNIVKNITAYVSYVSTFEPQSSWTLSGDQLQPMRGKQLEGGVKGDFFHHGLSVSVAGFRIINHNEGVYLSSVNPICGPSGTSSCYAATGQTRSEGAEVEVLGRPLQGWDINGSYTYNKNFIVNNGTASEAGLVYAGNSPRNLWKLWTHYRFEPYAGAEKNIWSIGGGFNAQTGTFGTTRIVRQTGYVVASAQVGYQWNRYLALAATLNNLSNTRYYERLGNTRFYNYYGAPRNFMLTLRSNF
ncbi:outer membrane receptor [Neokomagataea thailandica NBRC 106555]|uniref:TonB-dependent siderophore receptor n=2 Tax=Neokomagataea TaxID=1223423 RepID=A0A4Y6V6K0_9PROT|nr:MULTISPECIES: TonB-dependent siderophore receptor [Neokomagataea]QDH25014.1 TonB-dependent siderophore receptor [Neokomagataea tanensis]GBR51496.1 outer membrane receptor [Neokomagataea thailandica NBRC 106555]